MSPILMSVSVLGSLGAAAFAIVSLIRVVVPANEVHVLQRSGSTTSYGKDKDGGNSYLRWPASVPFLGVQCAVLPVSVFDLDLKEYEAYDKGRLPFLVDVKAFFRITDSDVAAQRVSSFEELKEQLKSIVQGSIRSILASHDIEEIMQGRGEFGTKFTDEVKDQLKHWGVEAVKNIELMDIKDAKTERVIHNIMAKKKSHIEMESRTEVAKNEKEAELAEINAKREVDMRKQEAEQMVGIRRVENERTVEIAEQEKQQAVKEHEKATKEKEMAIQRVMETRQAEINKEVKLVVARQESETEIIKAEQQKQTNLLLADGQLQADLKNAEGTKAKGEAEAAAKTAMELALVQSQIEVASKIGENERYQKYLTNIREIEAKENIGIKQAEALTSADVKIITNAGDPVSGMNKVTDLFTPQGGQNIGMMIEALRNTPAGKQLVEMLLGEQKSDKKDS